MGKGSWRFSLYFSPNVLSRFSNVPFIAINPVKSIPVYNTTFVLYWVLVLVGYKYDLDGSGASEVCVDAICPISSFDAFAKTFYIWYDYVSLEYVFAGILFLVLLGFLLYI